jgi:uncharacterized protein YbgA (DUF1722 family)
MRLEGRPASPHLVTLRTKVDHTKRMRRWARKRIEDLEKEDLCGFVFKSNSPSSGMRNVKVYDESGVPRRSGAGIFAGEFMRHFEFMPAEDDDRLHDPRNGENFIERVFVFKRWKEFLREDATVGGLVSFHTDHKLLVMAHSPRSLAELGRLVARATRMRREGLFREYPRVLMEGLKLRATVKKNTNVLLHIMGYFKTRLSGTEKGGLLEVIENYRKGSTPLIEPIVLLRHYVRNYNEPYLKRQYYLRPHPIELMRRNVDISLR